MSENDKCPKCGLPMMNGTPRKPKHGCGTCQVCGYTRGDCICHDIDGEQCIEQQLDNTIAERDAALAAKEQAEAACAAMRQQLADDIEKMLRAGAAGSALLDEVRQLREEVRQLREKNGLQAFILKCLIAKRQLNVCPVKYKYNRLCKVHNCASSECIEAIKTYYKKLKEADFA